MLLRLHWLLTLLLVPALTFAIPSVTINGPTTSGTVGADVKVTFTLSGGVGTMSWKVEVSSVNAGVGTTQVATGNAANGTVTARWTSASGAFPDANDYVVTVSATDTVPNTGSNQVTAITVNNTNFIKLTFPTDASTVGGLVRAVGQAGASWSLRWDGSISAATGTSGAIQSDLDSTTLSDGGHTVVLTVTNTQGDQSSITRSVTVKNNTLPVVRLTAPTDNTTTKGKVKVIGEAHSPDAGAQVTVTTELGSTLYDQTGPDHNINIDWDTVALSVPDGQHTITLLLKDTAGNENRVLRNVTIDNTGPAVNFSVTPTSNGFGKGTLNISGSVTDTSLKDWKITIDGGTSGVTPNTGTTEDITATWDTTKYNDAAHSVKIVATDNAGNTGQNTVVINTDNTKPKANLTKPLPNVVLTSGSIDVEGTVSDTNLDHWDLTVDGGTTGVSNPSGTGTTVAATVDTSLLGEGAHTLKLTAVDKALNDGEASVTFSIDKTGPVVTLTAPEEDKWLRATTSITGTATDSNLKDWVVRIDGVIDIPNNTGTGTNISVSWDTKAKLNGVAKFPDGPHTIDLTATDKAGNIGNFTRHVKIDNTAPILSNVKPEKDTFVGQTVAITGDIQEPNLDTWKVTIDGQDIDSNTGAATPVDVTWDTTAFGEGAHTIRIAATDKAGNVTNQDIAVTIDRSPPTVTIKYPFANMNVPPNSIMLVVVDITDSNNKSIDADAVDAKLKNSRGQVVARIEKLSSATITNGIRWTGQVNVGKGGGKSGNNYTVEVSVSDKAGNGPTVAKKTIIIRF